MTRQLFLQTLWQPYPPWSQFDHPGFYCGRVLSISQEGLTLSTETGEIHLAIAPKGSQVTLSSSELAPDVCDEWGPPIACSLILPGDVVAVGGESQQIYLLAPNLSDQPWRTGVKADLSWNQWLGQVEAFFLARGYVQIQTPLLVPCPGVDHHIDFMEVVGTRTQRHWTLPTSPEMALKKALCRGHFKVFEIKSCFRDDLSSPWHTPEFTMLEWYRAFIDLPQLQSEVVDLMRDLIGQNLVVKNVRVSHLFEEHLSFSLTPQTSRSELLSLAQLKGIDVAADDDWNDLFFRLWMEAVEPQLNGETLWLVSHFPPQQASLARLCPQGWAERFELYWRGVELANAYHELNDPKANRDRFQAEADSRVLRGASPSPTDPSFFSHLDWGLPPAAGIALGLSRLYRLVHGFDTPSLQSL